MINKDLVERGSKYLREGKLGSFLCGLLFFSLNRKNLYLDNLKYMIGKMRNNRVRYIIVSVNDNLMYIDLNDNGLSKELYIHKKREHFSTDFIKNFICEDDIIIDIGANIGYYALLESQLAKNGRIYAVEPIPSNINLLKKNIVLNNYENISVFQYAISDRDSKAKMYIYDKCNWCSFNKNVNVDVLDEIEVETLTLDKFVESHICENPTFIRMDVEGHEYQILKGVSKIFGNNVALKLCIELHPHLISRENMEELIGILKQSNFKVKAIFLDPEPHNYKNINIMNRLGRIIGLPEFGFTGNSYEYLDKLLKERYYAPIVFFERKA